VERVVCIGCFEKFLEMVLGLPRLALVVALGGRDVLLTGVVHFLAITVIAGSDSDMLGALLLPLLATLGTILSALGGGFGWYSTAAAGGRFHVTQNESSPNCLFTRGVSSGDIQQLHGGARLIPSKLMHHGMPHRARTEH
jgi:hypothetical protein